MGINAIFETLRTNLLANRPTINAVELTTEITDFHGEPERVVFLLPAPGGERYVLNECGPGYQPSSSLRQGRIAFRQVTVSIHCWLPGTVNARNIEVVNDNEDPDAGTVWLPAFVQNAIRETCVAVSHGSTEQGVRYELAGGGFLPRSMANLGFVYVFEATFDIPVYRLKVMGEATIATTTHTAEYI